MTTEPAAAEGLRREPGARRSSPWLLALAGAGVAAFGAGLLALLRPARPDFSTAAAQRRDLVVPVLCDAVIEPPPGGELRAPSAGTVKKIFLAEGASVEAGDAIVLLDSPDLISRSLEARAQVSELEAESETAASEARQLEKEVEYRRGILEGDQRLLASGAVTRSALDGDEVSLRQAEEKLASARERRRSIAGTKGARSGSRVELAERAARDLETRLASLTVRAAAPGRVYGLPRREGEAVVEGQPVASVLDPRRRRVRARVDPPDLPRVTVGEPLTVTFDGLPEMRWRGSVRSVDPTIRPVSGREVAEVEGEVPDPESRLPVNASVNVQIVVGQRPAALVVPRSALFREGDRRFVYVARDGRARRRDVTVGLLGLSEAEILAGLTEGERVLLPGAVPLSEGLAVKIR